MIVTAERRWTRDRELRPLWLAQEGWAGDWARRAAVPIAWERRSPLPRTTQGSVAYLPLNTPVHSPLALTGFLAPPHQHLSPPGR
jgi:hypothetical protein